MGRSSFAAKAKAAIGSILGTGAPPPQSQADRYALSLDEEDAPTMAMLPDLPKPADPTTAIFSRQLASGLWDDGASTDAGRLLATARALAVCARSGIDTSHAVYGAQVKKAVEAIIKLAAALAARGEAEREVMAALTAAFLVSSGKRLRGQVVDLARTSTSHELQALASQLTDDAAARTKLAELGA